LQKGGGNTRGFHYLQGGYLRKGFTKHGPLSNPHAFGYFDAMVHADQTSGFSHNLLIYQESALPDRFHNRLLAIELVTGKVMLSELHLEGSTFRTTDVKCVMQTDDEWFRPVDIKAGPDGCVYIADFCEQRISHASHYAGRIDRTNGRIYRLRPRTDQTSPRANYDRLSRAELVARLRHPDRWHRQTALRLLGERHDPSLRSLLGSQTGSADGQTALYSMWALYQCGGVDESEWSRLLEHSDAHVRAWAVQLACETLPVSPGLLDRLTTLAADESRIEVRVQLACSARRLPPTDALRIVRPLIRHDEDADDPRQPLLLWWTLESIVGKTDVSTMLAALFPEPEDWRRPLAARHLLARWMRRLAATGLRADLVSAAQLLSSAPDRETADRLLSGFEQAYQGRSLVNLPDELAEAMTRSGGGSLALRLRQGEPSDVDAATVRVLDPKFDVVERQQLVEILGQTGRDEVVPTLLQLLRDGTEMELHVAALTGLQSFDDRRIAESVLAQYPQWPAELQDGAEALLSKRATWATLLLNAIDEAQIVPENLSLATLRHMTQHRDPSLSERIRQRWGRLTGETTTEMVDEIRRALATLRVGSGNPKQGKQMFVQHCAKCHRLFEEGGAIGPDLTAVPRNNVERLLTNIVNPNLEIREGFENHTLLTTDGRVLTGLLVDRDKQVTVLRGVDGQQMIVPNESVEQLQANPQSVMPEGLLRTLSEQQLRDLFAYLRSSQPVTY